MKRLALLLFLLPVVLIAGVFLYEIANDYIRNHTVKPYKSTYAEGTFQAYGKTFSDGGEGGKEVGIEVSYQLEFHYYRTYPTGMTGKFIINGKEYPGRTGSSAPTLAQRLEQKRRGLSTFTCYLDRPPSGPFSPPTSPDLAMFASVILEKKQTVYWEITLIDEYAEVRGVFEGPATSREEYLAIFDIFRNLN